MTNTEAFRTLALYVLAHTIVQAILGYTLNQLPQAAMAAALLPAVLVVAGVFGWVVTEVIDRVMGYGEVM